MRAVLLILILAIVAIIVAIGSGFVDVNQTREARAPTVSATTKGVTASGGQSPQFQVETGSVAVGSGATNVTTPTVRIEGKQTQVPVPKVTVQRPGNQPAPTTNTVQ